MQNTKKASLLETKTEKAILFFMKVRKSINQRLMSFALRTSDLCKGQQRISCYNDKNVLLSEHVYRNNLPIKIYSYYPNGNVRDMTKYENGKKKMYIECYEDGSIKVLELYEKEFRRPVELRWFENGSAWQIPVWAGFNKDNMSKGRKYAINSIRRF